MRAALGVLLLVAAPLALARDTVFASRFENLVDTEAEAARLLTQATFGPTLPEITRVTRIGERAWIDEQLARPPTRHLPFLDQIAATDEDVYQHIRLESWLRHAMSAPDQLRQRVAFALSEILVVSDRSGSLEGAPFALAHYYDLLLLHAFGNYRTLLEETTLHPSMGLYLSMLGNRKPDAAANRRPDENYAREIMQLFSIGLVMLNADGTVRDGNPALAGVQPIPTYDQAAIRGFAHVFTGWKWKECVNSIETRPWEWEYCYPEEQDLASSGWRAPMQPTEWVHDRGAKRLLSYQGVGAGTVLELPANGSARADLEDALDVLFGHPNVGPFVVKQLIQRLVTSNPSPAYVARVVAVFENDGTGERGDLGAVVRAILLDAEARSGHRRGFDDYGKLREPLLRRTHVLRALRAASRSGRFYEWGMDEGFGQSPLRSPSVFNFFRPDYQPPGETTERGLVAPEFQITTDTLVMATGNSLAGQVYWNATDNDDAGDDTLLVDIETEEAFAENAAVLVDRYDTLFMNGQMSGAMRQILIDHVEDIEDQPWNPEWRRSRVMDAIVMIVTSSQYAVQQ